MLPETDESMGMEGKGRHEHKHKNAIDFTRHLVVQRLEVYLLNLGPSAVWLANR